MCSWESFKWSFRLYLWSFARRSDFGMLQTHGSDIIFIARLFIFAWWFVRCFSYSACNFRVVKANKHNNLVPYFNWKLEFQCKYHRHLSCHFETIMPNAYLFKPQRLGRCRPKCIYSIYQIIGMGSMFSWKMGPKKIVFLCLCNPDIFVRI